MDVDNLIFYVPPVTFTVVAAAFFMLWRLKVTPAWQWSAGFAQTAVGFVVSTFLTEPFSAAFGSGLIFIGAAYCYGSGLLAHFDAPKLRLARLSLTVAYTMLLAYIVFIRESLVDQLFLTDAGFAILLGIAVGAVARRARKPVDIALVVASIVVVLDSVVRTVFFTFFPNSSDNLSDFATSLYNLEVSISTITVCMIFPFTALGASASAAIDRHRAAAETDELTGLLNRRGFRRASEHGKRSDPIQGAIVICDIDHFKRINDTYGHAVGDQVIRSVALQMTQVAPSGGKLCRHGGEEFAVFLPGSTLVEAAAFAELLRLSVYHAKWDAVGLNQTVSISCGVAKVHVDDRSIEDVIDRADRALYTAKAAGRNRVCTEPVDETRSDQNGRRAKPTLVFSR